MATDILELGAEHGDAAASAQSRSKRKLEAGELNFSDEQEPLRDWRTGSRHVAPAAKEVRVPVPPLPDWLCSYAKYLPQVTMLPDVPVIMDSFVLSPLGRAFARSEATTITNKIMKLTAMNTSAVLPLVMDVTLAKRSAEEKAVTLEKSLRDVERLYREAQKLLAKCADTKELSAHRPAIQAIVGLGFNSDKSLRTHAADWVSQIELAYPGDTLKQHCFSESTPILREIF